MKIIASIRQKSIQVVIATVVLMSVYSCADNQNSTQSSTTDTANMYRTGDGGDTSNNGESNTNNNQNKMMADSANYNSGNTTINNNLEAFFMEKAAEINMEEIKLGKLAQQKGTKAHVKEMGKMMVAEHTKAMADLTALAKTKTVTLPTAESVKMLEAHKMLNAKSGKDFDLAYSTMMVDGHKEAIALFEKTNTETKDADVKAMTTAMIPALKKHLEHAEKCKRDCEKM